MKVTTNVTILIEFIAQIIACFTGGLREVWRSNQGQISGRGAATRAKYVPPEWRRAERGDCSLPACSPGTRQVSVQVCR